MQHQTFMKSYHLPSTGRDQGSEDVGKEYKEEQPTKIWH
jgi:hypothetical protein